MNKNMLESKSIKKNNMKTKEEMSSIHIPQFYANRSVFLTGGTGFLGKVLIEKLLRCCPDIRNIYMLVRPKRGKEAKIRLEEILSEVMFDNLRKENPSQLKKLKLIDGDIMEDELGISKPDQDTLIKEVSIVVHSAATIRFDEPLKIAVNMNVKGTKRVIELSRKMKKLVAFVHVSTAFSNCDRKQIDEVIYTPNIEVENIIQCVDTLSEEILEEMTPKLIGSHPNTYTYTKNLGEQLINEEKERMPMVIVRPSIVIGSWKDPLPGWIDNFNTTTGLCVGIGKGVIKCLPTDGNKLLDQVPVDLCTNLIIAAAWRCATNDRSKEVMIYNCTSESLNPFTIRQVTEVGLKYLEVNPFNDVLWVPFTIFCKSQFTYKILSFFLMYLPLLILDTLAKLQRKKAFFLKAYDKFNKSLEVLNFFMNNDYKFSNTNLLNLNDQLYVGDADVFCIDIRRVDNENYAENFLYGIRKYLLKEGPDSLEAARRHFKRMVWFHYFSIFMVIFYFAGLFTILTCPYVRDQVKDTVFNFKLPVLAF